MTTHDALPLSALLRNTALETALLADGAAATNVDSLRARCRQLVDGFAAALEARKVPADVACDALYMQCGLLDEMVLAHLPGEVRPAWEARPLQVERLGKHDAGEHVFDRLAVRMREAPLNIELIECYATVLGLGFCGRYARGGDAQRNQIVGTLSDLLAKHSPAGEAGLVVDASHTRGRDWLYRLSAWAIAGLACAAAAIVFVLIGHGLDLQVGHLLAAKT